MLNNFIYAKQKSLFEEALNNGEVLDEAIVFIEDTKEIWNHGTYFDGSSVDLSSYNTKEEIAAELVNYAKANAIPTKISQLENDANYVQDDIISNGVYAVDANGKLIDYNTADTTALGVALVAGKHKFMIAKSDATNDGSNYNLYYDYDKGDLSLTNYSNADGTNNDCYLGTELSTDFTTWTAGALSDFNGKSNTQVIAASSSKANDMCKVLETFNAGSDNQGHSDWYVPAAGQLALMYLAKTDINAALAKIGGTAFKSRTYWSSSEVGADRAWYVNFSNGLVNNNGKRNINGVRFIRDIPVPKPLKERVSDLESKIKDLNTMVLQTVLMLK